MSINQIVEQTTIREGESFNILKLFVMSAEISVSETVRRVGGSPLFISVCVLE